MRLALALSERKHSDSMLDISVGEKCNQMKRVSNVIVVGAVFFRRDMSSVILFAAVLIHWELMPRGQLIRSEQKKRASLRPIFDLLHAPVVQLRYNVLSVTLTLRRTGCGLSVKVVVVITWKEAI